MSYNSAVESFRDEEYPMMQGGKVYLDHGGTTIYCKSLVEQLSTKLLSNLYGNPHSDSDPAQLSSREVEETRRAALEFFGADPKHFDLVFTANASAAIKLVGESFYDLAITSGSGGFAYSYHRDAHTSLVGIRELTNQTQHHCFQNDGEVEDWLDGVGTSHVPYQPGQPGLFAYPGQSNMTGRRLPLQWTKELRASEKPQHQNTYSLLDAAALATTTQLDLSDPESAPDFTAVSFYKIFGLPDLGALIVRKESGHILAWRRYFGGGTINMLTVCKLDPFVKRKDASLHEALEDGTLPFHSIIALGCAMKVHQALYGSMKNISRHTSFLAQRLYNGLSNLRHENDRPVCLIYTDLDHKPYQDPTKQGATVAFSVVREDGSFIGHSTVEKLANEQGIFVRSGGLCNAGGIAHYLQIENWQFKRAWSAGVRCGGSADGSGVLNGKATGVVRASLGAMSTISDVDTFLDFMSATFETRAKLPVAVTVELIDDIPQEVLRFSDQGFSSETEVLQSGDSGFHSHAGSSSSSVNQGPKITMSMSNMRYENQRSQLKSHRSEETLRAARNQRHRNARLILPPHLQRTVVESDDPLSERGPRLSYENYRPPQQRKLQKSGNTKSSVQTHSVVETRIPLVVEVKADKLERFKFWKKRHAVEQTHIIF